jgi:hypothetical protein
VYDLASYMNNWRSTFSAFSANALVRGFLGGWAILNCWQSYATELHADEAYYWVLARHLDWGYFDHPPMIALLIRAGEVLFANELGLRLGTVLLSTASAWLMWLLVRPYALRPWLFCWLWLTLPLLHVYGFITTPDVPMFFFGVLFWYLYRRYLEQDGWGIALLLACCTGCLLYSKYHGVLLVGFTVLSNLRLLRRRTFWLVVVVSLVLLAPHVWWQVANGSPSLQYHLFDRSPKSYRFAFTSEYLLGTVLVASPLVGWYLFYQAAVFRAQDALQRAWWFTFVGVFLFFLANTLKGRVEVHWTLLGFLPLLMLAYVQLAKGVGRWFFYLSGVGVVLMLVVRVLVALPMPFKLHKEVDYFFNNAATYRAIAQRAGGSYVVFPDGFQDPSKYNFYTQSTQAYAYNSIIYRRNHYNLTPAEQRMQGQRVYYVSQEKKGLPLEDSIATPKGTYFGAWIDSLRTYQNVWATSQVTDFEAKPKQLITLKLLIHNPYPYAVSFGQKAGKHRVFFEYAYKKEAQIVAVHDISDGFDAVQIPAAGAFSCSVKVQAPAEAGKYYLLFAIRTEPFARGSRNSPYYTIRVQ